LYFVVRVRCRRKESSRSLSHFLMSFLSTDLGYRTYSLPGMSRRRQVTWPGRDETDTFHFYRATAYNATHGLVMAILSVRPSVRPSVRQSVRLSNAFIVTKRNNHLSIYRHYTIKRWFYFLEAKFYGTEFRGAPRTSVLKKDIPCRKCKFDQ